MTVAQENNSPRNRKATLWMLFAATVIAVFFASCDSSVLYNENMNVDEHGWNCNDKMAFNFETDDTTTTYLFCIDIRNTIDYPFSNIFFNIKSVFPDGSIAVDTNIEFHLAHPDGRWMGKTSGKYVDGRYPLCFFHFPQIGTYQFVVQHAMRDTILPGIKNLGLHIEKAGK